MLSARVNERRTHTHIDKSKEKKKERKKEKKKKERNADRWTNGQSRKQLDGNMIRRTGRWLYRQLNRQLRR